MKEDKSILIYPWFIVEKMAEETAEVNLENETDKVSENEDDKTVEDNLAELKIEEQDDDQKEKAPAEEIG